MMSKFLASVSSVTALALAWTPELASATGILIAAIFVGIVNIIQARTARLMAMRETAKAIAPIQAKLEELAPVVHALVPVVEKIEGHVNSEKTRAEGELAAHKLQIELQREMIDELKKAAALLAQAEASNKLAQAVAQAAVAGATTPILGDKS